MRVALLQLSSSDDPDANLPVIRAAVEGAAEQGARWILTPEVTNCVSASRSRQMAVAVPEAEDATLAALREDAARLGVWITIGSLALKSDDPDGRLANRGFLIAPDGSIAARYDKIHMFDVQVSEQETYRESAAYCPGDRAVIAQVDDLTVGMAICYDLRFPHLFRTLAQAGAGVLTVPAAFSPETGVAHWEPLLRARAIECGAYVLAPAQTGQHAVSEGRPRRTWGHSLVVSPWGEVLADGGEAPGAVIVDLDPAEVARTRGRVPSLSHDRPYTLGGRT